MIQYKKNQLVLTFKFLDKAQPQINNNKLNHHRLYYK